MPPVDVLLACVEALRPAVDRAGARILAHLASGVAVERKGDASPVTVADREAEAILLDALASLPWRWPVIAEESAATGIATCIDTRQPWWLVDPLDGTREFIDGRDEFTVNVALVVEGRPCLGIVQAPALDRGRTWWGIAGAGAWQQRGSDVSCPREPLRARMPGDRWIALCSRSHDDRAALAAGWAHAPVAGWVESGSSVKLCRLGEGEADLYPRLGPTMAWDIAAGQAVLEAAGGAVVVDPDGTPLRYDPQALRNPPFLAVGAGEVVRRAWRR